jgi:hypothetical protein
MRVLVFNEPINSETGEPVMSRYRDDNDVLGVPTLNYSDGTISYGQGNHVRGKFRGGLPHALANDTTFNSFELEDDEEDDGDLLVAPTLNYETAEIERNYASTVEQDYDEEEAEYDEDEEEEFDFYDNDDIDIFDYSVEEDDDDVLLPPGY